VTRIGKSLLALTVVCALFPASAGAATGGGLKQLVGTKGCIVDETSTPSGCEHARAMQGTGDVVVTPDGRNVYVSATSKDAIVAFDRNPATGELTQKTGITGCYTTNSTVATSDSCNLLAPPDNLALTTPTALAASPDGLNLYVVTNSGRLTSFNRAADGSLAYNDTSNYSGTGATLSAVTVSPDGASVYIGGTGAGGAVGWYRRSTTPGPTLGDIGSGFAQCFGGVCSTEQNFGAATTALAVTPDGKELVIGLSTNTVVLGWDRDTSVGGNLGRLTPSSTPSRCVSDSDLSGTCQVRAGMNAVQSLALADNGATVHVGSQYGLATIGRNTSTNALTPDTAGNCFAYPSSTFSGCTAMPGTDCCTTFYPARDLVATPDGRNLYLGTEPASAGIFGFTRSGGNVTIKPAPLGCTNTPGSEGCTTFRQGNRTQALAASNDNRNLYAVGNNRLFTFALDRPPTCQNVDAAGAFNTAAAVHLQCSDPDGDALTFQIVGQPAKGSLGSVQGNSVNYGPLLGTSGTDSFTYRAIGAGVPSDPATATVNVAGPADKTAPHASVSVPKQKLGKVAKSGKLVVKVKTNEAGSILAQAVLEAKLAKKLGLPANGKVFTSAKAKPAIVAKGKAAAPKAATYKVTLKLTTKAKKKLRHLKKVKLSFRARVADKSGNRRLLKKSITLKR
jgi:hypothetical protein